MFGTCAYLHMQYYAIQICLVCNSSFFKCYAMIYPADNKHIPSEGSWEEFPWSMGEIY